MFGKLLKAAGNKRKAIDGRLDVLQGAAAAMVYTAAAEGGIDAEEKALCESKLASNDAFSSFNAREKKDVLAKQIKRASEGASGNRELMKELEDVGNLNDSDASETIMLVAIDVARAGDGKIGEREMARLQNVAAKLNVSLEPLLEEL